MTQKSRMKQLLQLSPKIKQLLTRAIILVTIFEILKIAPPYIFKEIIDSLVIPETISLRFIIILVGGYFASMLIMTAFEIFSNRILYTKIRHSEHDVVKKTLAKLLTLDVQYHEEHNTGENINKILKGSTRLVDLLYHLIDRFLPICIQAILTLAILFATSWEIGTTYLLFIPLFITILAKDSKTTQTVREKYHIYHDKFASTISQAISNIRTVKNFNNETKELAKAETRFSKYVHYLILRTKIGLKNMMLEDGLVNIARSITLLISVWLMINQRITAGELVFIMTLTEKAYLNLRRLSRVYFHMQDSAPSIQRFSKILTEKTRIKDKPNSKKRITKGRIEFKNVSFSYGDEKALKNVSFEIEPKQVVAFVGKSGSGKTTLIKLLLRNFDPKKGEITIDQTNLKEYSLKNLRKDIAIVSQDVELFNETILENIAYGQEKSQHNEIIQAAKMAHAHEFITKFKNGYSTIIGEKGVRLSGGQKQRIAIARALLKKPKILIFDEATSSLDSESEQYIHKSIKHLIGTATLIIIAHRFATIEHANKIILLDKGKIKETGTHKELVNKKGIFAKLRKLQELGEVRY